MRFIDPFKDSLLLRFPIVFCSSDHYFYFLHM